MERRKRRRIKMVKDEETIKKIFEKFTEIKKLINQLEDTPKNHQGVPIMIALALKDIYLEDAIYVSVQTSDQITRIDLMERNGIDFINMTYEEKVRRMGTLRNLWNKKNE
jgi:hypothetical protein